MNSFAFANGEIDHWVEPLLKAELTIFQEIKNI